MEQNRRLVAPHDGSALVVTVVVGDTETEGQAYIKGMNYFLRHQNFVVPALTGSHTAELKIRKGNGNDIFTSGELAESTTHSLITPRLLIGDMIFRVETSGAESGAKTFRIELEGD